MPLYKEYLNEEKKAAERRLNQIIDKQFPLLSMDAMTLGKFKIPISLASAYYFDNRLKDIFIVLEKEKEIIHSISAEFGVPPEVLGAVILREQYCEKISDEFISLLEQLGRKGGSVGLGAIQSRTAREAWEFYIGSHNASLLLPEKNEELVKILSVQEEFNIRTIAAVLVMYAVQLGLITDKKKAAELSMEDWRKAVGRYNSTQPEQAQLHSNAVFEYMDDIRILLDVVKK